MDCAKRHKEAQLIVRDVIRVATGWSNSGSAVVMGTKPTRFKNPLSDYPPGRGYGAAKAVRH